ncbi:MAG: DUF3488 and transglutaminase-like domain-containing protein [Candidatus Acidiferrales bacterium]
MTTAAQTEPVSLPAIERYFEVSLFLLVSIGIVAVISTGKLDLVSMMAPAAVLVWKGVRIFRHRGPELSPRAATGLVLAYFFFFPLDLWFVSRSIAIGAPNPALYAALLAAIHLMIFATLVRLLSSRTQRDQMFLAMLAVTCMLASAILTVDTTFLISLAIFLLISVSTFVGLEIRRSAAGAVTPPLEAGSPAAKRLNRSIALTSVFVTISALIIGGGIFFLIPRFTAGYLSALSIRPSLMTGFSDNVSLNQIGEIKRNTAVVMRVHIAGDPGGAQNMHWRGIVLTDFDGRRWSKRGQEQIAVVPSTGGAYLLGDSSLRANEFTPLNYTVLLEPIATDAIFVAPRAIELRGRFGPGIDRPGAPPRASYIQMDATGTLTNPSHNDMRIRYDGMSHVPSVPPARLRMAPANYPDVVRRIYLQLPPLDPRVKTLADSITATSKNPYDAAANIERHLRTRYSYTLNIDTPPDKDPLAYFLFEKKAGHCEYFASAMTVMLRAEGIPARFVTGFLPGEYNDVAGDYIVRASDAHAWVEAYFPGYGWITFDPTPPGDLPPASFFARFALYWDWFQYNWNEWIVSYDFGHQEVLALGVQHTSQNWAARIKSYYERKRDVAMAELISLERRIEKSRYLLPGSLGALLILLLILRGSAIGSFVRARWSLRAHRDGNLPPELAALEYREMLKLLERRGWRKMPAQTPLEFAASIPDLQLAGPVSQLTEMYQSSRFGAHPANAGKMASLLAAMKDILRAASRHGKK